MVSCPPRQPPTRTPVTTDYKRYPVLYVDDEAPNLVTFRYSFEDRFTIFTASSGSEAIEILHEHNIAILLADQRMPGMTGVELCARSLVIRPDTIRIIITAYSDSHDAIAAINQGRVSQYVHKPWNNEELVDMLEGCIDLVHVQRSIHEIEQRVFRSAHLATDARERVAHEMKNPLTPLLLHVGLAQEEISDALDMLADIDDPRAQGARERLLEAHVRYTNARDAFDLVDAIQKRYLSADSASVPRESTSCDAARVVDAVVRVMRASVGGDTDMRVELNGMPIVNVPASVLSQIVLNLVTNAAEAVHTGDRTQRLVTVGLDREGAMVVLRLADTGCGIPAKDMRHIFEPRFSTKADGTGLGLAIVRDLVEHAGGTIRVQSAPEAGTTFEVRLPATPSA